MERPSDLFDRTEEWSELAAFASSSAPGLRVGVVWGRRRQGKSFLLRRLVRAVDGFYHQAHQLERSRALDRFSRAAAQRLGVPTGSLRFPDWEVAFRTVLGLPGGDVPTPSGGSGPARLLVLDELPYLLDHSPEIPSVLQELWDETHDRPGPPSAVLVCGSALSVMADLLSGARAPRGRAALNLLVQPFDFRLTRDFWQIEDPETALLLDALVGGTPGYRALIEAPVPADPAKLLDWLAGTLLNPAHALFDETGYLLREDPRIQDKALYNTILNAVATGHHGLAQIGAVLGRASSALAHPIGVLTSAGFLRRADDVLLRRRPSFFIADPIVRFGQVVVEPYRELLEEREVATVWTAIAPALSAQVLGPHFEAMAQTWTRRFAGDRWPEPVGEVGPAVVNDARGKAQYQLDVVALPRGTRRYAGSPKVVVLGEAKASARPRPRSDLDRLERIRSVLATRGVDVAAAQLALFGRAGFDKELRDAASRRSDVHLIGLTEMYGL